MVYGISIALVLSGINLVILGVYLKKMSHLDKTLHGYTEMHKKLLSLLVSFSDPVKKEVTVRGRGKKKILMVQDLPEGHVVNPTSSLSI